MNWLGDVKVGLRGLRKQPGFALLAVLTLALGIGPVTAVYAVFRQVLLRELPVAKPQELVLLHEQSQFETGSLGMYGGDKDEYFSAPAFRALRATYGQLAATALIGTNMETASDAQRVITQMVSGNYFAVMGEVPVLGRMLTPQDDKPHAGNAVAVLSEAYWRREFGGNPAVLNSAIKLNGAPFTIVGVVRDNGLMDDEKAAVFVPVAMREAISLGASDWQDEGLGRWLLVIARIPAGVDRNATLNALNGAWVASRRDTLRREGDSISNAKDWMNTHLTLSGGAHGVQDLQTDLGMPLRVLQGMAALVLLVACANLANLLLARAAQRRGEIAVRAALGASRIRMAVQTLTDGLLLGFAGTALGALVGWAALRALSHGLPVDSNTGMAAAAPFAWPVLLAATAMGVLTSVLFSVGPAIANGRVSPSEVLSATKGAVARDSARARGAMVSITVAFSLLLLCGAALFAWNLYKLSKTGLGFRMDHLLMFSIDEPATGANEARTAQMYQDLLAAAKAHAGVTSVAYSDEAVLGGNQMGDNISVAGRPNQSNDPPPDQDWVSSAYFQTLGIPLLRGRLFTDNDNRSNEQVAVVDQAFVHTFFHDDVNAAVGGHFGFGSSNHEKYPVHIVGVVPVIHHDSVKAVAEVPYLYLSYAQTFSSKDGSTSNHPATFYLQTSGDPQKLATDMRALMHRMDAKVPVRNMKTMQEQVNDNFADTRLMAELSSGLGLLAAVLSAVGLYSVLAFQVATRTREIGVRMAVGASKEQVVGLLLKQMLRLAVPGMLLGGGLAFAAEVLLRSAVSGLTPAPMWLYGGVAGLLLIVALMAAAAPAARAARVEPMQALRAE